MTRKSSGKFAKGMVQPVGAGSRSGHGKVHMVDVGSKPMTERSAIATGKIFMNATTLRIVRDGKLPKGDVLAVARVAGILAAKRTSETIPMCHPISLSSVDVELVLSARESCINVTATARAIDRTGVEMEALVATTTALLTIYDMCKQVDKEMSIGEIALMEKSGGKSGHYKRKAAIRRQG